MPQFQLTKPVAIALASVFGVLLLVGFWFKMNPSFDRNSYFRNAAKATAAEEGIEVTPDANGMKPPPVASDKAYQPESGSN